MLVAHVLFLHLFAQRTGERNQVQVTGVESHLDSHCFKPDCFYINKLVSLEAYIKHLQKNLGQHAAAFSGEISLSS